MWRRQEPESGREPIPEGLPKRESTKVLLTALVVAAGFLVSYMMLRPVLESSLTSLRTPQQSVNLTEGSQAGEEPTGTRADVPAPKEQLRVAIAPVLSPEKSVSVYEDFVRYLARRLHRTPVLLSRSTYAEVNDLVQHNQCDMALVCTYALVRGEKEFGMRLLAVPEIDGSTEYYSYIIASQSSRAESLLDLRGKRFAFVSLLSNSGWLYPTAWLREHGEDPDRFFGETVLTGSHDSSVNAVADHDVDGAAVDSIVYGQMVALDPELGRRTRIVQKSPPFGTPPLVVPQDGDPVLREQLLQIILTIHEDGEGQKALAPTHIDRFVAPDTNLYDSVRRAARVMETPP